MANEISPENARYIDNAVRDGVYDNTEQALNQAVDLLRQRDRLRADVRAGIKQADAGQLLDADEVFERLEKRAAEIAASSKATE